MNGPVPAGSSARPFVFDLREAAGAVADLGPLVSIAAVLIVQNGLDVTAVLLPAGLLYLAVGLVYRLPVPVQPMKAFGGLAIAYGLGPEAIAAGALLLGITFVLLGLFGLVDALASRLPLGIVRGVQLYVGLVLLEVAAHLVLAPSPAFTDAALPVWWRALPAVVVLFGLLWLRRLPVAMVVVTAAVVIMVVRMGHWPPLGSTLPALARPELADFRYALTTIVVSQIVLTLAGTCVATSDAARVYYPEHGQRVTPGRLAISTGGGNLLVGLVGGMPLCHGSGGITAHRVFGARSGGAPVLVGALLCAVCLLFGQALSTAVVGVPLAVLAALIAATGMLHVGLLREQRGLALLVALVVGALAFLVHIVPALIAGLALHWLGGRAAKATCRTRRRPRSPRW